jgi:hypothetical protein
MNKKLKQQRFFKYFWLLHTPKKLIWSFINARILIRSQTSGSDSGSGYDQKGPDPDFQHCFYLL